jgi:hypothetical protein
MELIPYSMTIYLKTLSTETTIKEELIVQLMKACDMLSRNEYRYYR